MQAELVRLMAPVPDAVMRGDTQRGEVLFVVVAALWGKNKPGAMMRVPTHRGGRNLMREPEFAVKATILFCGNTIAKQNRSVLHRPVPIR